ncbi:MAG: uroporphyrinogen decarboxylase [Pyrinomonadaceae bacterium]
MKKILVIRKFDIFSGILAENNYEIVNFPLIETKTIEDLSEFQMRLLQLENYDGIFLTSRHAARILAENLREKNINFSGKIYVLGKRGFDLLKNENLDLFFDETANTTREMLEKIPAKDLKNKRFLFLRGEKSLRVVPEFLAKIAPVDETIVYETQKIAVGIAKIKAIREKFEAGEIIAACFFSPSAAASFIEQFGAKILHQIKVATIGKTTAEFFETRNLKADFVSSKATAENFAFELIEYLQNGKWKMENKRQILHFPFSIMKDSLFIRACKKQKTERTPVWIMRQAGRYLPEYRAIRQKYDFLTMCKTPELASEVTVQPIDIIKTDAAILFSDILVIPEAMGMRLEIIESKGPVFDEPIRSLEQIEKLQTENIVERLNYVLQAVKMTKEKLNNRVPLIGFSGSPWTLAAYMVEGCGSKNFEIIKSFIYNEPQAAHKLLRILADSVIEYLNAKIRAGCDAVQIFDTWASILSPTDFEEFSLSYIRYICENLETRGAPVIVFAKGISSYKNLAQLECDVLGVDWTRSIGDVRAEIDGGKALQGNLDPTVLFAPKEKIRAETERVLQSYGRGAGHIFNLGHGITPKTPVENVKYFVECVKELSAKYHAE